ncbi:polyamine ABC transporter substrate-binding protein [Hyphomicrobium sp. MC8b]|uniref:polyamine ABC transporter substrate-binding protein n=1 Tax=unclassified Hyphomicrobium TaxID=2619925 RepID=UPI003918D52D
MRPLGLLASCAIALSLVAASPAANAISTEDKNVNIYFWYDYVSPDVIKDFEKQTGDKVVYDTFESTEMMTTKVLTGKTGYDIVLPTASSIGRLIQAGALQKLDKSKLAVLKDFNPDIMKFVATEDPGNQYGVPYAYGTTGIMYNPALIEKRMKNAPVNSLDIIFKPELAAKFQDCGIAMIDSPEGVMSIALNYLGFDPFTTDKAELEKASKLLDSIRPYIRHFKTGAIINDLAQGDVCLALGWSGDAYIAAGRAADAKKGVEVRYSIPKEGTEIFADMITLPADAPHPENAYAFINFLLASKNIATFTNNYWYPNANTAATEFVTAEIKSDPNIYPPKDMMAQLFAARPRDPKSLRDVNRIWTHFMTGE